MFKRFAIYFVPDGPWGDFGAKWLGWDNRVGKEADRLSPDGLTDRPRQYGFHATLKPPFRLVEGASVAQIENAAEALCATQPAFTLQSLQLAQIGKFFALTAPGEQDALSALAEGAVRAFDPYRAPLNEAELARRRAARLSARQEALLAEWGYPYVMEEFRFHLTLTGPVNNPDSVKDILAKRLQPMLETPLTVNSISLLGEAEDGRFHQINRFAFAPH